jgi:hypothetical protein
MNASLPIVRPLPPWSKALWSVAGLAALAVAVGVVQNPRQCAFSYLLAFMFFLSVCLGALLIVLLHHLFDAHWSVPIRRFLEHLACLLPVLGILFIPLAWLGPQLYAWMNPGLMQRVAFEKSTYLNLPFFYLRAALCFIAWSGLAYTLRHDSLRQDESGAAIWTYRMRRWSAGGIVMLCLCLTTAAIDWMQSLQPQWYSTMYGVYFFAGCIWVAAALAYVITVILKRAGWLPHLTPPRLFRDLGVLMLTFTVFSAYVHFGQYLIIWNGNMPEETYWYVLREKGSWWNVGLWLVFGHFLAPFLILLRIDLKLRLGIMVPLACFIAAMQWLDLSFNIMPTLHPDGFHIHWLDLACWLFIGSVLALCFLRWLCRHPVYPLRDPRLKEFLTVVEVPPPAIAEGVQAQAPKLRTE